MIDKKQQKSDGSSEGSFVETVIAAGTDLGPMHASSKHRCKYNQISHALSEMQSSIFKAY
jgi:hypothetical protein